MKLYANRVSRIGKVKPIASQDSLRLVERARVGGARRNQRLHAKNKLGSYDKFATSGLRQKTSRNDAPFFIGAVQLAPAPHRLRKRAPLH